MTRARRSTLMKTCVVIWLLVLVALPGPGLGQETAPLRWVHSIPLPQVEGRIDHLAMDLHGQRLFVAALGNNTVEVLDLQAGTRLHTLTGLQEPQGVLFLPEIKRLVVTNGAGDTCEIFDGETFARLQRIPSLADADNL